MEANKILNRLFEMRDNTHVLHLQTKSYAEHLALNQFYDAVVDLADEFAENYQGATGETITGVGSILIKEGIIANRYLQECLNYFEMLHKDCEIVSVKVTFESIIQLLSKTLYLLTLK